MDPNCTFCRRLAELRDIPADELVWEFPHSVALLGPWQYYHGYCVLVSRRHVTELFDLDGPERIAYFEEMIRLARAIARAFRPRKVNYELLGNQVRHPHWHVFPRYEGQPDALQPAWVALHEAEKDETHRRRLQTGPLDRQQTVAQIREALQLDCQNGSPDGI